MSLERRHWWGLERREEPGSDLPIAALFPLPWAGRCAQKWPETAITATALAESSEI